MSPTGRLFYKYFCFSSLLDQSLFLSVGFTDWMCLKSAVVVRASDIFSFIYGINNLVL